MPTSHGAIVGMAYVWLTGFSLSKLSLYAFSNPEIVSIEMLYRCTLNIICLVT